MDKDKRGWYPHENAKDTLDRLNFKPEAQTLNVLGADESYLFNSEPTPPEDQEPMQAQE